MDKTSMHRNVIANKFFRTFHILVKLDYFERKNTLLIIVLFLIYFHLYVLKEQNINICSFANSNLCVCALAESSMPNADIYSQFMCSHEQRMNELGNNTNKLNMGMSQLWGCFLLKCQLYIQE